MNRSQEELPVIQKMYDLILWYVPVLSRLPREQKFTLGDRITNGLYETLEELILCRFAAEKQARLQYINGQLDVLRYQTRLLRDFKLMEGQRYAHVAKLINEVGGSVGGWLKQQRGK